ncbi:MAG: tetratricopeptide repeat protein [Prevotellaceae bacterium]|nr:tetratricopeptide repeat protein [Prevotellaceae bacterium]
MMRLNSIKELINQGDVERAITEIGKLLHGDFPFKDEAYYLCGNAYRKLGNWQQALNNYRRAIDLNPASPAFQAYRAVMDILEFYNKEMYNQ